MSRRKQRQRSRTARQEKRQRNSNLLKSVADWLIPTGEMFTEDRFHGNSKWAPEQVAQQALIWGWQETRYVTDAFDQALEVCEELSLKKVAKDYTSFMNAIDRYRDTFYLRLGQRYHAAAEEVAGRFWRDKDWFLIAFDGSRSTTPRTVSNEESFCAPNYGNGATAKYRQKQTKGMRRTKNEKNKAAPQVPQVWITMMWHMSLRLPWAWRLGPSNSSERRHVMEMLEEEEFPENTLFCGDAGFVGYPLWSAILAVGGDFLVRVGGNVNLLSENADFKRLGDGIVLCWPKDKMKSGAKPLRLRLVKVKIGKTTMWMLTSVLSRKRLSKKQIVRYYKMRWGVEVEYRGLKQTLDKRNLRCRDSRRAYAELDWSIRAMAFAELLALREQIGKKNGRPPNDYDTKHRSLANTMRAIRKCMRQLHKYAAIDDDLLNQLSLALVKKYNNHTDKKSRYRPKNPDKKPLGEPTVRKLDRQERHKLKQLALKNAA